MPHRDPRTLAEPAPRLDACGSLAMMNGAFDVDTAEELGRLGAVPAAAPALLPTQRALLRWIEARA